MDCAPKRLDVPWFERGEDVIADYDRSGDTSNGDIFLFNFHRVTIGEDVQPSGEASGLCTVIDQPGKAGFTFCSIVFSFPDGELMVQGFYPEMTIVAAGGCLRGTKGVARGRETESAFEYTFEIAD
eukprot:scaffold39703_cov191-Amphora_coffeaeformis.AAC.3